MVSLMVAKPVHRFGFVKDQKVMNDGRAEGRYCWTADIITDYDLSDEHVSKNSLGMNLSP